MTIPGSANPLLLTSAGAAGGYEIERSLRFNSSDSAYLGPVTRTGNKTTWTLSFWIKRCKLGRTDDLFGHISGGFGQTQHRLSIVDEKLYFVHRESASNTTELKTIAVFRDPSAWYHVACVWDTNNGTSGDRARLYVNGKRVTAFDIETYPSSGKVGYINDSTYAIGIGAHPTNASSYLDAYLADVWFVDGYAGTETNGTLDDFGEFDVNGIWQPKEFTGSATGTSFHLPFSDNSTAAALGTDTSGNGNTWTVNNISVTAGAGNDSLVDSPTNYGTDSGAGGEVRGNYCTWNPLINTGLTISNGNLEVSGGGSPTKEAHGTLAMSNTGKWYFEITATGSSLQFMGIGGSELNSSGTSLSSYGYNEQGRLFINASDQGIQFSTFGSGDIIGFAVDLDANTIRFYKNGVAQGSGTTSIAANKNYSPLVNIFNGGGILNAGQRPFAYTAPSGFKALCTTNLPEPTIADGSQYFQVIKYTGNGTTQTLPNINSEPSSGLNFSPDLVWIKSRSNAQDHYVFDFIRDSGILRTNTTGAEATGTDYIDYNSDGFVSKNGLSSNGYTYAAWCWDAGTSTVTNTQGSITSQVRASASSGFSVVTFTAPSSGSATIGHGLGVEPYMIIIKSRDQAYNWCVYHKSLTSNAYFLNLNTTAAQSNASNVWNNTTPTSTVFSLGSGYAGAGATVAYAFAPVAGYSNGFSFVGNGSSDGTFVYLGFRPRFIILKSATSATSWFVHDSARSSYNAARELLFPNLSSAEDSSNNYIDLLSNGFKLRFANTDYNTSGQTYIGFAWAENPFQYARAR